MPGGVSYRCATLTVGGTQKYDIRTVSASLSADMIYNRADCRIYPQQAASTNHMARIEVTTLDISNAPQASSSSALIGSSAGSVVLTIANTSGGSFVVTQNPSVYVAADFGGTPQEGLMELTLAFEAAGTGGTEPTVSWATSA